MCLFLIAAETIQHAQHTSLNWSPTLASSHRHRIVSGPTGAVNHVHSPMRSRERDGASEILRSYKNQARRFICPDGPTMLLRNKSPSVNGAKHVMRAIKSRCCEQLHSTTPQLPIKAEENHIVDVDVLPLVDSRSCSCRVDWTSSNAIIEKLQKFC